MVNFEILKFTKFDVTSICLQIQALNCCLISSMRPSFVYQEEKEATSNVDFKEGFIHM